jgi:hypothetical protein
LECRVSSASREPGHRLACPKFQPRSGVSASFAETRGVMGEGRCDGGSVSGLGQAGGRPSKGLRASARGVKWEGHRLACPKLQPRSGVSAGFAEAPGVMGAGRRGGGSTSRLGQANRSPGRGGGSTSQMARRAQRAGARARQRLTLQEAIRCRARGEDLTGLEVASPDREV